MNSEGSRESSRHAILRFALSGILFSFLGPALFWLIYPLGPLVAVAVAELSVHAVRFTTFRQVVFPAHKGYRVSLPRYMLSALPASLAGVLSVAVFRNRLDRSTLTIVGALIAAVVGFVWSRYVYSQPVAKR